MARILPDHMCVHNYHSVNARKARLQSQAQPNSKRRLFQLSGLRESLKLRLSPELLCKIDIPDSEMKYILAVHSPRYESTTITLRQSFGRRCGAELDSRSCDHFRTCASNEFSTQQICSATTGVLFKPSWTCCTLQSLSE